MRLNRAHGQRNTPPNGPRKTSTKPLAGQKTGPAPPRKRSQHVINYGLMAALALMLLFLVFGEWGLLRYQRLAEERRLLEERSQALKRKNELLREQIHRIKKDDRYLEKVAREDLGLARKGEIIFLFPSGGVNGAGARTAARSVIQD